MSEVNRELKFLLRQYLDEENLKETMHMLERESGFFFDMKYFEDIVTDGRWEEVEKYLSGFTKDEDNRYSVKIYFEIRKQRYLEALDRKDYMKAVDILKKDLKEFSRHNEDLFKEMTLLIPLNDFRENEQLSRYVDTKSARANLLVELKRLIEANPLFRDKLQFPSFVNSRLRALINHSLNWQHQLCKNPKPNPEFKTLFVDHTCGQPNVPRAPSPVIYQLMGGGMPNVGGFPPIAVHNAFLPPPGFLNTSMGGWITNTSAVTHQPLSGGPLGFGAHNNTASMVKRPTTPQTNNLAMDYQSTDSEHVMKRSQPFGISEEGRNVPANILPVTNPGQSHAQSLYSSDDLPKTVIVNLNQNSAVKSMDFHPAQQTLLLVGTSMGDVSIWEIGSRKRIVFRNFKVWNLAVCSEALKASLANEYAASVNRVIWSPDGILFGVAYSKHIVHIYSYRGADVLQDLLEIDAHIGNVSDLAFARPINDWWIITCGEDKAIKVWDADTGTKKYSFEGNEAPIYSVCPHVRGNCQFIFSTDINGRIKIWLYNKVVSEVQYDAPHQSCMRMAYSADGVRLFSCGTSKDGESYIVEWNEKDGAVKRMYHGLGKRSVGVVQFDTIKNRFLAAGDEFVIKFWDMDNSNLLMTTDAEGGLPASPRICFNKEGTLLAVSTSENGIKVLGNAEGIHLVSAIEDRAFDASRPLSGTVVKNLDDRGLPEATLGINKELSMIWKQIITEPSRIRSLKLPDNLPSTRIVRLMYTNLGGAILSLASNAVHKVWSWPKSERNTDGKATTSVPPVLRQPSSGIQMINDTSETNPENVVPCFAISKNDSYIMSASGGKISLFYLKTFKTMTSFLPPPPAATSLAFHPLDNNVIAIGMDDCTVQIYNARLDEIKTKLIGHQKRVTGLAFSIALKILISTGADAQLCVWSSETWEKQTCEYFLIPSGRGLNPLAQTQVQFHQDQKQLMVVHETQVAIYEAPELKCITKWVVEEGSFITDATYSCDSQLIFASFRDGSVGIFTSPTLQLSCKISPTAYIPSSLSSSVYPLAIAANPIAQGQFALGLNDGNIFIIEPLEEGEGKWGLVPPQENGVGPSSNGAATSNIQGESSHLFLGPL